MNLADWSIELDPLDPDEGGVGWTVSYRGETIDGGAADDHDDAIAHATAAMSEGVQTQLRRERGTQVNEIANALQAWVVWSETVPSPRGELYTRAMERTGRLALQTIEERIRLLREAVELIAAALRSGDVEGHLAQRMATFRRHARELGV